MPGDIRLVVLAAKIAKQIFPNFQYGWIADEFEQKLPLELDFRLEAKNCIRCETIFKDSKDIHIPHVYSELTRPRVLVMSFEEGVSIGQV